MAAGGGAKADVIAPNGKTGETAAALELAVLPLTGLGIAANGLKTPLPDGDRAPKTKGELLLSDAEASKAGVDRPEAAGAITGVWALAPNGKTGKTAAALQLAAPTGLGTAENGFMRPSGRGVQDADPKLGETVRKCDHLRQPDMSAAMRNTASTGLSCDADDLLFFFRPCVTQAIASASRKPSSMSCTASPSVKFSSSCGKALLSTAASDGVR